MPAAAALSVAQKVSPRTAEHHHARRQQEQLEQQQHEQLLQQRRQLRQQQQREQRRAVLRAHARALLLRSLRLPAPLPLVHGLWFDRVARWMRRTDVFAADALCLPLISQNHWTLLLVHGLLRWRVREARVARRAERYALALARAQAAGAKAAVAAAAAHAIIAAFDGISKSDTTGVNNSAGNAARGYGGGASSAAAAGVDLAQALTAALAYNGQHGRRGLHGHGLGGTGVHSQSAPAHSLALLNAASRNGGGATAAAAALISAETVQAAVARAAATASAAADAVTAATDAARQLERAAGALLAGDCCVLLVNSLQNHKEELIYAYSSGRTLIKGAAKTGLQVPPALLGRSMTAPPNEASVVIHSNSNGATSKSRNKRKDANKLAAQLKAATAAASKGASPLSAKLCGSASKNAATDAAPKITGNAVSADTTTSKTKSPNPKVTATAPNVRARVASPLAASLGNEKDRAAAVAVANASKQLKRAFADLIGNNDSNSDDSDESDSESDSSGTGAVIGAQTMNDNDDDDDTADATTGGTAHDANADEDNEDEDEDAADDDAANDDDDDDTDDTDVDHDDAGGVTSANSATPRCGIPAPVMNASPVTALLAAGYCIVRPARLHPDPLVGAICRYLDQLWLEPANAPHRALVLAVRNGCGDEAQDDAEDDRAAADAAAAGAAMTAALAGSHPATATATASSSASASCVTEGGAPSGLVAEQYIRLARELRRSPYYAVPKKAPANDAFCPCNNCINNNVNGSTGLNAANVHSSASGNVANPSHAGPAAAAEVVNVGVGVVGGDKCLHRRLHERAYTKRPSAESVACLFEPTPAQLRSLRIVAGSHSVAVDSAAEDHNHSFIAKQEQLWHYYKHSLPASVANTVPQVFAQQSHTRSHRAAASKPLSKYPLDAASPAFALPLYAAAPHCPSFLLLPTVTLDSPQQRNGADCGPFASAFASAHLQRPLTLAGGLGAVVRRAGAVAAAQAEAQRVMIAGLLATVHNNNKAALSTSAAGSGASSANVKQGPLSLILTPTPFYAASDASAHDGFACVGAGITAMCDDAHSCYAQTGHLVSRAHGHFECCASPAPVWTWTPLPALTTTAKTTTTSVAAPDEVTAPTVTPLTLEASRTRLNFATSEIKRRVREKLIELIMAASNQSSSSATAAAATPPASLLLASQPHVKSEHGGVQMSLSSKLQLLQSAPSAWSPSSLLSAIAGLHPGGNAGASRGQLALAVALKGHASDSKHDVNSGAGPAVGATAVSRPNQRLGLGLAPAQVSAGGEQFTAVGLAEAVGQVGLTNWDAAALLRAALNKDTGDDYVNDYNDLNALGEFSDSDGDSGSDRDGSDPGLAQSTNATEKENNEDDDVGTANGSDRNNLSTQSNDRDSRSADPSSDATAYHNAVNRGLTSSRSSARVRSGAQLRGYAGMDGNDSDYESGGKTKNSGTGLFAQPILAPLISAVMREYTAQELVKDQERAQKQLAKLVQRAQKQEGQGSSHSGCVVTADGAVMPCKCCAGVTKCCMLPRLNNTSGKGAIGKQSLRCVRSSATDHSLGLDANSAPLDAGAPAFYLHLDKKNPADASVIGLAVQNECLARLLAFSKQQAGSGDASNDNADSFGFIATPSANLADTARASVCNCGFAPGALKMCLCRLASESSNAAAVAAVALTPARARALPTVPASPVRVASGAGTRTSLSSSTSSSLDGSDDDSIMIIDSDSEADADTDDDIGTTARRSRNPKASAKKSSRASHAVTDALPAANADTSPNKAAGGSPTRAGRGGGEYATPKPPVSASRVGHLRLSAVADSPALDGAGSASPPTRGRKRNAASMDAGANATPVATDARLSRNASHSDIFIDVDDDSDNADEDSHSAIAQQRKRSHKASDSAQNTNARMPAGDGAKGGRKSSLGSPVVVSVDSHADASKSASKIKRRSMAVDADALQESESAAAVAAENVVTAVSKVTRGRPRASTGEAEAEALAVTSVSISATSKHVSAMPMKMTRSASNNAVIVDTNAKTDTDTEKSGRSRRR